MKKLILVILILSIFLTTISSSLSSIMMFNFDNIKNEQVHNHKNSHNIIPNLLNVLLILHNINKTNDDKDCDLICYINNIKLNINTNVFDNIKLYFIDFNKFSSSLNTIYSLNNYPFFNYKLFIYPPTDINPAQLNC